MPELLAAFRFHVQLTRSPNTEGPDVLGDGGFADDANAAGSFTAG